MNTNIFIFIGTIVIFLLEVLFVYIWFTRDYLPEKRQTSGRYKRQVKDFYTYRWRVWRRRLVPSAKMEEFLKDNKQIYRGTEKCIVEFLILANIFALFASGFLVILAIEGENSSSYVLLPVVAGMFIVRFYELWINDYARIHLRMDEYNNVLHKFASLKRAEESRTERKIEIPMDYQKEKQGSKDDTVQCQEITEDLKITQEYDNIDTAKMGRILLIIADLFILAAGGSLLYDVIRYWNNWDNFINIKLLFRPSFIFIVFLGACGIITIMIEERLDGKDPFEDLKKKYRKKRGIILSSGLMPWEKDIQRICKNLRIDGVEIIITNGDGAELAKSTLREHNRPLIWMDDFCRKELEKAFGSTDYYKVILFVLGHELAHIKSGDSSERNNRILMALALAGFVGYCLISSAVLLRNPPEGIVNVMLLMLAIFSLYMIFVIFYTWNDKRYWGQLDELRADRRGLQASGVTVDIFRLYVSYYEKKTGFYRDIYDKEEKHQGIVLKFFKSNYSEPPLFKDEIRMT